MTITLFGRRLWESKMSRLVREEREETAERERIENWNRTVALKNEMIAKLDRDRREWQRGWERERMVAEQAARERRHQYCKRQYGSDFAVYDPCA